MRWEDQGRQQHGRFGHGTAPPKDKTNATESDPMFESSTYAPRIQAIAHTAFANMPRKERYRHSITFDKQRLAQLREAMTAWIGARSLTDAAFEDKFVDRFTGNVAIAKLRAAAENGQNPPGFGQSLSRTCRRDARRRP